MPKFYRLDNIDEGAGDLIKGWELHATMQLRTPLKWLQRHREFHAGSKRPAEKLPPEHAIWIFVLKSWRDLGIDEDEVPESTIASQIGQIPKSGGEFLPFLLEYRMIVEDGGGTLDDLVARYPKYRDLMFPPRSPRNRARKKPRILARDRANIDARIPKLSISVKDVVETPGSESECYCTFEFHCLECGGYMIKTPDNENEMATCTACGITFGDLSTIKDACRQIGIKEIKARKLGAFRKI